MEKMKRWINRTVMTGEQSRVDPNPILVHNQIVGLNPMMTGGTVYNMDEWVDEKRAVHRQLHSPLV